MLSWSQAAGLGLGLAVLGLATRAWRPLRWAGPYLAEAAALAFLYAAWQLVLDALVTRTGGAVAHGRWVWDAERRLHLPSEAWFQRPWLAHTGWARAADVYYGAAHFTVMGLFLAWLFTRHRDRYPRARTTLLAATLAAAVIQAVPVAPPRLVAGLGVVDTARRLGQSVYGGHGLSDPGQLIAMPSDHVAWAALVALGAWTATRSRWRLLGVAHLLVTVVVVVATGNHYWLDAAAGLALTAGCWALVGWAYRRRAGEPAAAGPPGTGAPGPVAPGAGAPPVPVSLPRPWRAGARP